MQNIQAYSIIAIILYVASLIFITYKSVKKESADEYIIGGRKIGILGTTSSLIVSNFDGTGLIIFFTLAAISGFGFLWLFIGMAISALLLATFSKPIYKIIQAGNYVNVSDMFAHKIGKYTSILSSAIIIFLAFFATAGQLYISGKLVSAFIGYENEFIGIIVVGSIVASYLTIGGYKTVIKTDILQWISIILIATSVLFFADLSTLSRLPQDLTAVDSQNFFGWLLWGIVFSFASPFSWQRYFSAKSSKTMKKGLLYSIPGNLIFAICIIIFVISITNIYPEISTNNLAFEIYTNTKILPVIGPLLAVVLLALIMSSLDTYCYAMSSTITSNILKIDYTNNKKKFIKYSKITTLALFALMASLAVFISDFVTYMVNTCSIFLIIAPAYLLVFFVKEKSRIIDILSVISFSVGLIVWIYMFKEGMFDNFLFSQIPMLCSLVINIFIILIAKIK